MYKNFPKASIFVFKNGIFINEKKKLIQHKMF